MCVREAARETPLQWDKCNDSKLIALCALLVDIDSHMKAGTSVQKSSSGAEGCVVPAKVISNAKVGYEASTWYSRMTITFKVRLK